jgi:hypothetical protein
MGGACSTKGGEEESQRERDHQKDLDVGGSAILRILEKQAGIVQAVDSSDQV